MDVIEWRILLADGDSDRCTRWLNQLAKHPGIENVRCVDALDDVRAMELPLPFDVCLVSAGSFPPDDLVAFIAWMTAAQPQCRTIVHESPIESELPLRCLEAGAWSCLPERANPQDVLHALEAAGRGESLLAPEVAGEVIRRIRQLSVVGGQDPPGLGVSQELTPREREILALVTRRMSNSEIARELVVEVGTVKNHVHSLLKKLGVESRHEAAALGLQEGLVEDVVTL
jgi:DNA-binding NarL/FixJ family response regulator